MKDKIKNLLRPFIHLAIMAGLVLAGMLVFFYVYLPLTTNKGQVITVPDLYGLKEGRVEEFLSSKQLRYEVSTDSGFSAKLPPLSVLHQHPKAGSKVKEGRKVYLTLNAVTPPQVKMPDLVDGSLKNAEIVLRSFGLERGEIRYEPDRAHNAVLKQLFEGKEIESGTMIPKGGKIDLVVGNGIGKEKFELDSLLQKPVDEVRIQLSGSQLKVGSIVNVVGPDSLTGTVVRQSPKIGEPVRVGEEVDLWVINWDTLNEDKETEKENAQN